MGAAQWEAMIGYLKGPGALKFVATPAMLLPRRLSTRDTVGKGYAGSIESDAWDGYPASLHALLATIAEERITGCIFLSGNEHMGIVAEATVRRRRGGPDPVKLLSVHAGAMYAPYPFANSREDDFLGAETFDFEVGGVAYECDVSTWFPDV